VGDRRPIELTRRLGGVKSNCVEWCSGELAAGAMLGLDHAPRVADSGGANQAADDHKSAGDLDSQPEGIDRGSV